RPCDRLHPQVGSGRSRGNQGPPVRTACALVVRRARGGARSIGRAVRRSRSGRGDGRLPPQAHALLGGHDAMSTPIRTRLAVTGEEFGANAQAMTALVGHVRTLHDQVLAGGGPQCVERHRARGKMMVRERVEALVDPGTPVLELCPLAGLETGDPVGGGGGGALTEVAHTQCLVIANDPTVRGGTTSPTTIKKLLRAMDVAETNRLPLLVLVE